MVSHTSDTFTVHPNWNPIPDNTSRFIVCHWPKRRQDEFSGPLALTTAGEVLDDVGLINYNQTTCQSALYAGANSVYESKRGGYERIEHVYDQLNGVTYGLPVRYYK